jgi:hypothetical protein
MPLDLKQSAGAHVKKEPTRQRGSELSARKLVTASSISSAMARSNLPPPRIR